MFVIASCNNEDEISDSASLNNQDDSTSEIILQERDPNLPKVWSKKIAPRPSTWTSFTDATDFLGNSYAIENVNRSHVIRQLRTLRNNFIVY